MESDNAICMCFWLISVFHFFFKNVSIDSKYVIVLTHVLFLQKQISAEYLNLDEIMPLPLATLIQSFLDPSQISEKAEKFLVPDTGFIECTGNVDDSKSTVRSDPVVKFFHDTKLGK